MNINPTLKLPKNLRSVPGWVLSITGLTPGAWRLLVALWSHATEGETAPVVYPGPARRGLLADDGSKDGRSQRRWLTELEDAGLVRCLTDDELDARQRAGLVASRDCRVLVSDPELLELDVDDPEPEHEDVETGHERPDTGHERPPIGHERPPIGHERPPDRTTTSGQQRPDVSFRQIGQPRPPDRTPVSAPIEQFREQSMEHDDVATNVVPLRPSRSEFETKVFALLLERGIGGVNPGPTFVAPIVERLVAGDCDLEAVAVIADEWKRRRDRGDSAQGQLRQLFYEGKSWQRTQREYLGRSIAELPPGRARSRRASANTGDRWDAYEAELGQERGR